MYTLRKANERGHVNMGWLDSHHSFSFGSYYNPKFMGFRTLRVINDDRVQPSKGFGTHPHDNMEIISYVVKGTLAHKDSMGNGSDIKEGDVQLMSAGTGVTHSEYNASNTSEVRFLQIWLPPANRGLKPSYQQKNFAHQDRKNALTLLVSPTGEHDSLTIHQDARLYGGLLDAEQKLTYHPAQDRYTWIQVVNGDLNINDEISLTTGDGLAIYEEDELHILAKSNAEFLVFDLA